MPSKCCVPGCKSNYASSREGYVPCFRFPEEQNQREKWIKRIPRQDLPLNNRTVVCIKHFSEDMVSLIEKYKNADGVWKEVPRRKALLLPNAVPHIFPNLPSYLSAKNVPARRNPEERKAKHLEIHTEQVQKWLDSDIKDFESLTGGLKKELYENWLLHSDGNSVVLFISEFSDIPKVRVSMKITEDMICQVSVNQNLLTKYELKWILPSNLRLERWSQLKNILARYKDVDPSNVVTKESVIDCTIENFATLKKMILENSRIVDWDKKLCFLSEQFNLMFSERRKYSPEMTIWAFMVFMQSPVCYTVIRETCFLTLPHPPKYLQQLSASLKVSPACKNQNSHFLQVISRKLTEREICYTTIG